MEVSVNGFSSFPEDILGYILGFLEGSELQYLRMRTRISFLNTKCRERFLAWIQQDSSSWKHHLLIIAEPINPSDLNDWRTQWGFEKLNRNSLMVGSFHTEYAKVLEIGEWQPDLRTISLTDHFSAFQLSDYAQSIYKEKHSFILENISSLNQGDKIRYILDLRELSSTSKDLENAVVREVGITTKFSYIYAYVKPERKEDRDLFIMTKSGKKKKIYLNGLRSVYDSRVISEGVKLYDISCKQRNKPSGKFEATSLLRGDALISSMRISLLKCRPVIERLRQLKSRLSKKSRHSKRLC